MPLPESASPITATGGLSRRSALTIAAAASAAFAGATLLDADPAHATSVPASARADAQALLASGRVTFGHPEPRAQIEAYAAGTKRNINGRDCHINGVILAALRTVVIERGFSIQISSLNRYCEMAGNTSSYHYLDGGGRAVDINRVNGMSSTGGTSEDRALINAMTAVLPAPAGLGQMGCAGHTVGVPSGWVQFPDACNHNHFEYRGSGDSLPTPPSEEDDLTPEQDARLQLIENLLLVPGQGYGWPQVTAQRAQDVQGRMAVPGAGYDYLPAIVNLVQSLGTQVTELTAKVDALNAKVDGL